MRDWIEWNGVSTSTFGIVVLALPDKMTAVERASQTTIPGRSGSLTILEGKDVYDAINLSCTCLVNDLSRINDISAYFRGKGTVRFANFPDGYYKGRISNQIALAKIVTGDEHRTFSLQFIVDPFFYLTLGDTPVSGTMESGETVGLVTLNNPGNLPSQPLVKIEKDPLHTGDWGGTIMVGDSTMIVSGLTENDSYIILDCEAKVAYKGAKSDPNDPLTLLNHRVTHGAWMTIPVGNSTLQFTGDIQKVTVTPRWRTL